MSLAAEMDPGRDTGLPTAAGVASRSAGLIQFRTFPDPYFLRFPAISVKCFLASPTR